MNPFIIAVLAAWLNPAVTQDNIAGTICRHGWTATVRPPLAYTEKLKRAQMRSLGIKVSMRLYEEDHFIPLELGGNPVSVANLWLQAWHGACSAAIKDIDERVLNRKVCRGQLALAQAQLLITQKWLHCKNPQ